MAKIKWEEGCDSRASMGTSFDRSERLVRIDIKYHINPDELNVVRPPSELTMEIHEAIRKVLKKYKTPVGKK